jgi:hypothetical protein
MLSAVMRVAACPVASVLLAEYLARWPATIRSVSRRGR